MIHRVGVRQNSHISNRYISNLYIMNKERPCRDRITSPPETRAGSSS